MSFRYVAIFKPLHYQQFITPTRAGFVIVYIWLHSAVLASLPLFEFAEYAYVEQVAACTINWKESYLGFTIALNLFLFFLPLLVILICYANIFHVARKIKRQIKPRTHARRPFDMDIASVPANFGMQYEDRHRK